MTDRGCWASSLGDCDGKISREHLVSRSAISPLVKVVGFPWTGKSLREISASSLTAKILCQKHNSELSPLDSAAAEAVALLSGLFSPEPPRDLLLNGLLLERWVVKTAVNLYYGQRLRLRVDGPPVDKPPAWLVQLAFGRLTWPPRTGLCICDLDEDDRDIQQSVEFSPALSSAGDIVGTLCVFHGLRMIAIWGPAPLARFGKTAQQELLHAKCYFHLSHLDIETPYGTTRVAFNWVTPGVA